jgi:hypothetical protein
MELRFDGPLPRFENAAPRPLLGQEAAYAPSSIDE